MASPHLQAAEFLYEARLFPDLEYTFKHALTHEVAYGSLLQERRHALHAGSWRRSRRSIPTASPSTSSGSPTTRSGARRGTRPCRYLRQAGAKAFARSANREAVGYFEQALAALAHLPETRETLEQAIDLRLDLRNALYPARRLEIGPRAISADAERLARQLGDQRRLGLDLRRT